jgi:hypothetical protein
MTGDLAVSFCGQTRLPPIHRVVERNIAFWPPAGHVTRSADALLDAAPTAHEPHLRDRSHTDVAELT